MNFLKKFKYILLKTIDISGFKVLDPPVRLIFGEEPDKQVKDIIKYMFLPIVFCLTCFLFWNWIAPQHKTKSGQVPTPPVVWQSAKDNYRYHQREAEKAADYNRDKEEREALITEIKEKIPEMEKEQEALAEKADEILKEAEEGVKVKASGIIEEYDSLEKQFADSQEKRTKELETLATTVSEEEFMKQVREDVIMTKEEKDELSALKFKRDEALANFPTIVTTSRMAASRMANEILHSNARLEVLEKHNKELKIAKKIEDAEKDLTKVRASAAEGDAIGMVKNARKSVADSIKAEELEKSKYAKTATILWQTKRSIVTVIIGFLLAAAVAIPVGIMCGLNRIVMACLTPLISIFRPVSPVVWLLIFQIIVGAFFPNPEKHWLLNALNHPDSWMPDFVKDLQVTPAMIFSACTVAMCALWPALVNTALGVSAIDKDHLNVAKVLRLGFWSRLFKIIIPSSLPLVFAGLRISLGVGWMVLIAAEALSNSNGLGKYVWDEFQNGSSQSFANIILACFVVGIVGFFLDRLMIILQRFVSFDDGSATA